LRGKSRTLRLCGLSVLCSAVGSFPGRCVVDSNVCQYGRDKVTITIVNEGILIDARYTSPCRNRDVEAVTPSPMLFPLAFLYFARGPRGEQEVKGMTDNDDLLDELARKDRERDRELFAEVQAKDALTMVVLEQIRRRDLEQVQEQHTASPAKEE